MRKGPQAVAILNRSMCSHSKAQYQRLQDSYDDEVLLCSSLLHALVNADSGFCESLVKHADCSAERKADALAYLVDARAGYG